MPDATTAVERDDAERFDCVVTRYDLPDADGISLLETLRAGDAARPVVLCATDGTEALAEAAAAANATDYLRLDVADRSDGIARRIWAAVERGHTDADDRVRATLDVAPDPILVSVDGTVVFANWAAVTLLGADAADDVTGRAVATILDADALGAGPGLDVTHGTLRTLDGRTESATVTARRIEWNGTDAVVAVVGDDEATADRATDDRSSRTVIDRMSEAVIELDADWRFTTVDETAEDIYGTDGTDLLGRVIWDVFPDAVGTQFHETYQRVMETREAETIEEYYEGLDAWFRVHVYPAADGGLSIYFDDISEDKERERVLRRMYDVSADRTRSFEEQVDELLALGCETLGTDYGTLSRIEGDEYVFEVVRAPDDSLSAGDTVPLSETNCERTAATEETLVLANIEEEAPSLASRAGNRDLGVACYLGAPVVLDDGVYGTFCFYDDEVREGGFSEWEITLVDLMSQWVSAELARQRTTEALAEQNERLEEFASIVSHDLRNPLNVAEGRLALAREDRDDEDLAAVQEAHEQMRALIEDLLTLAREGEESVETTPLALDVAAREAWTTVDDSAATLVVDTDRVIHADEAATRRLLTNLFRNAVEHAGPDVTVTVGALDGGFYVADDGPGVPAEDRDAVFEAGFTTADAGTGFGLRIVKRVAESHGWSVTLAESDAGGVRFEFEGVAVAETEE
ncbi:MAG: ATP-binding protein [Halobacteriaceae archaeon]